MKCPFCNDSRSGTNVFENDYILATLEMMLTDMKTEKPLAEILDKHACILTAYMNGVLEKTQTFTTLELLMLGITLILTDEGISDKEKIAKVKDRQLIALKKIVPEKAGNGDE